MKQGLALLAVLGAIAALGLVPAKVAEGGDPPAVDLPDVAAPRIDDPISEAELTDLLYFATQEGISLDAAIARNAWNDNFALAVARIREEYPGAFSAAEIVDRTAAWVAFADDAPDGAIEVIHTFERAHPSVVVAVSRGVGFTEVELEDAIENVHFALLDADFVRDVSTSFDFDKREISSVVALDEDVSASALDELRATAVWSLAQDGATDVSEKIGVSVVQSDVAVLGGDDEHIGGEALSTCTTGFTVRHVSLGSGVGTAGHCGNSQSDDGAALTYRGGHEGTHGDFQWHTGPQAEPDDFYAGSETVTETDRRDVAAVGAPVVGQLLCKNGKAAFKDCLYVIQLNVCHFQVCNLVQMDAQVGLDGDSGGPWYWNNTAYGFHKGWRFDPAPPFDRSIFSRADRIDNALNVTIATN